MVLENVVLAILFFLLFGMLANILYSKEVSIFQRFDILFLFFFFLLFLSRILSIILNWEIFDVGWSFNPLTEVNGRIFLFASWPWIFFRWWDLFFNYDFYVTISFLAIILTIFIFRSKIILKSEIISNYMITSLIMFTLLIILQSVTAITIIDRQIEVANLSSNSILIIINTFILVLALIIRYINKSFPVFALILLMWGIINTIIILNSIGHSDAVLNNQKLYYLDIVFCTLLGLVFVMRYLFLTYRPLKKEKMDVKKSRIKRDMDNLPVVRTDYSNFTQKKPRRFKLPGRSKK